MYVLDTNVASELMRPAPESTVAAWVAERNAAGMFLMAISEAELRHGVAIVPAGRRRNELEAAISRSRGAVLVTHNIRDFEVTALDVVDPWTVARS